MEKVGKTRIECLDVIPEHVRVLLRVHPKYACHPCKQAQNAQNEPFSAVDRMDGSRSRHLDVPDWVPVRSPLRGPLLRAAYHRRRRSGEEPVAGPRCEGAGGQIVLRRKARRAQVLVFFGHLAQCLMRMDAYAGAHRWAGELAALRHEVRLMPPSNVNPYVKRGKTNQAGAEAIHGAVTRPTMRVTAAGVPLARCLPLGTGLRGMPWPDAEAAFFRRQRAAGPDLECREPVSAAAPVTWRVVPKARLGVMARISARRRRKPDED